MEIWDTSRSSVVKHTATKHLTKDSVWIERRECIWTLKLINPWTRIPLSGKCATVRCVSSMLLRLGRWNGHKKLSLANMMWLRYDINLFLCITERRWLISYSKIAKHSHNADGHIETSVWGMLMRAKDEGRGIIVDSDYVKKMMTEAEHKVKTVGALSLLDNRFTHCVIN